MTLRQEILKTIAHQPRSIDLYDKLKSCLIVDGDLNHDGIDTWFKGAIQSLFYNPNHYCLVIEGADEIENRRFFRNIFPIDIQAVNASYLYNSFIFNIDFERKVDQDLVEKDNFIIFEDNLKNMVDPSCDKRLCSYCSTTDKWTYPPRKNFFIIKVKSIDFYTYDSIPKLDLWIEIFNRFK